MRKVKLSLRESLAVLRSRKVLIKSIKDNRQSWKVAEEGSENLSNIWDTGELNGSQKGCVKKKVTRQQSVIVLGYESSGG